jgi:hypothetical protein
MAQLVYQGKDANPAFDVERIEGLRLANALARVKLQRLGDDVISRREVAFALSHMLLLLRTQILTVPSLVSVEVRGILDPVKAHDVRQRVETAIHRFLTQLSENMEAAMSSEGFLAKLEASLSGKSDEDAAQLKHDLAKRRRTEKRHAKAGKK